MTMTDDEFIKWFERNITKNYKICDGYGTVNRNGWNFVLVDNHFIHYVNGAMHNLHGPASYQKNNVMNNIHFTFSICRINPFVFSTGTCSHVNTNIYLFSCTYSFVFCCDLFIFHFASPQRED